MIKRNNILFTTLAAAIIIVGLSFVLPKNGEKYLGDMFWVRKTFAPSNKNVVLMGDSRIYRGLSPQIIHEHLPELNIFNFGYSDGGLNPTMFSAAEKKLTDKPGFKAIVLGVTANTLSDYTKGNNQYIQELNRSREEILERLYLNPISYWFSAVSPEQLKDNFKHRNTTKESWYISNYKMNGYVESDKFPADTLEALPLYRKDFSQYQVDEKHLHELFEQVETWTKQGITVLAFRPPISKPMWDLENTKALYKRNEISAGITKAGGHWVDLTNGTYKTYDGSHIDRPSAEKLSLLIAKEIKQLTEN